MWDLVVGVENKVCYNNYDATYYDATYYYVNNGVDISKIYSPKMF